MTRTRPILYIFALLIALGFGLDYAARTLWPERVAVAAYCLTSETRPVTNACPEPLMVLLADQSTYPLAPGAALPEGAAPQAACLAPFLPARRSAEADETKRKWTCTKP